MPNSPKPQPERTCSEHSTSDADNLQGCPLCGTTKSVLIYGFFEQFDVVRCRECRLVYTTLAPDRSTLEEMYSETYYHTETRDDYYFHNCITDEQVEQANSNIQDFLDGLALIEKRRKPGRLLDVGCAIGIFLSLAKQHGWDVKGIDVSPFAVSYAKETLGVDAVAGELHEARFPDNYFDVITLWDVIEHFPDPVSTLKEVRRILKDDGIVFVDTQNEQSLLKLLARVFYVLSLGRFTYPVRKMYHQWHLYYFTPRTLKKTLGQAGFRVDQMEQKSISREKARGRSWERAIVALLALPGRLLRRETELIALAVKDHDSVASNGRPDRSHETASD